MRHLLATSALLVLTSCAAMNPPKPPPPLAGSWGGQHIGLSLTPEGGTVDYDCASGRIDGPVVPNAIGEFHVRGTHTASAAGPVREGQVPQSLPALYSGSVKGSVITLEVVVPATGLVIGPTELQQDRPPQLTRCY
jgi:hypothetical protein